MSSSRPQLALLLLSIITLSGLGCSRGERVRPAPEAPAAEDRVLAASPSHQGTSSEPPAARDTAQERVMYVPAYSHLPRGGEPKRRSLLSILLSVRNVDVTSPITLTQVDYFDTEGRKVRRYLDTPRTLKPLETAEFNVTTQDESGGSGANFLVSWAGPLGAQPLLAEAVMTSKSLGGFVAFTSRGIELTASSPKQTPPSTP